MTKRSVAALAALTMSAMSATAAGAATYVFNASLPLFAGGTLTGTGRITTDDTFSPSSSGGFTGRLARSITGTYDGARITGLAPVNTVYGNDNLIDTSGGLLDYNGIAFELDRVLPGYTRADGFVNTVVNLYNVDGWFSDSGPSDFGTFTVATVPEPATWAMMLVGLGGVGYALRQRRERVVAA